MPITTTGRATDFITFTRTSNATVTDSNGFIKWAGHNLLTNSESFDASAWSKTGVTVTANSTAAPNSTTTADTLAFTTTAFMYTASPSLGSIAGLTLTSVIWLWTTSGKATIMLRMVGSVTGTDEVKQLVTLTSTPTLYTLTRTFTSSDTAVQLGLDNRTIVGGDGIAGNVIAWGAHLYRSDLGGMVLNPARGDAYYPTTPSNLAKYTESWGVGAFGWTIGNIAAVANYAVAPNGLQTADLIYPTSTGTNRQTYQSTAGAVSGTRVVVSAYLKSGGMQWVGLLSPNGNNYGCYFDLVNGVKGTEAAGVTGTITSVGNGWYRCSVSQVLSSTTIYGGISLADADNSTTVTANGTSGIYAWGLQMSDSASLDAYSPVYGAAVTSAAYYAPRLDYDPVTLAAKGLLVEEQRTNISPYSEVFSSWNTTGGAGVTINSNVAIAPSGAQTADEAVAQGANASVSNPITVANTVYTLSLWVRAGTSTAFRFGLYDTVSFVNATGSIISGSGSISGTGLMTVTGLTSSWTRVSLTTTAAVSAGAATIFIYPGPFPQTAGDSVMLWGAQLEVGASNAAAPFPTSYIPTGAATATRTADVASVSTQAFPYSATEGTIVVSWQLAQLSGSPAAIHLTDDAENNRIRINAHLAGINRSTITASGSLVANIDTSTAAIGITKYGLAGKTTDYAVYRNGLTGGISTNTGFPAGCTELRIGRDGASGNFNGHIRQITYLPRRISNAELQSRTA